MADTTQMRDSAAIQNWLAGRLSDLLYIDFDQITPHDTFQSYGLSSRETVSLSGELETWLGCSLDATILWEYPTIETLARHLTQRPQSLPDPHHQAGQKSPTSSHPKTTGATIPVQLPGGREPIALIGIGCRFPGAAGPSDFWRLLCEGGNAISEVSTVQDARADYMTQATPYTRGGFLPRVDGFDAAFFGISPREAVAIDPQQRLLLEVAWEALEDAGQDVAYLSGSETGVFIGIAANDYSRRHLRDLGQVDAYAATGSAFSIAANRLSYVFDWHGPSMAVDTACSSALVAVHLACQSIWNNEASMALAGGVNLILDPAYTISMGAAGALSPDGQCKTFDDRANGYVRGEGAGVVVLKPLSAALRDHDLIYAQIRGSAVSQDGHTNGLMAPARKAQEQVLRKAYQQAGIDPALVRYIEAHGTGTLLGDPIEVQALHTILAPGRPADQPCKIGSVKTNIGHLESAAGIAGLIKVALMLKHQMLVPQLHFQTPNPHIPFERMPLRVQTTLEPWPEDAPTIAGVSSFGFGGTNAHMVIEAATNEPSRPQEQRDRASLLVLSARSPQALHTLIGTYANMLHEQPELDWTALCATAGLRRTHHEHRMTLVADSLSQAHKHLQDFVRTGYSPAITLARARPAWRRKLAFVFSGHGSQWLGMGRQLLTQEPIFRATIEACEQAMRPFLDWSLLAELQAEQEISHLDEVDVTQPLIFAVSAALATLWQSWGIVPDAVIGHSMGEVAAAYVAGILRLEDACRVICERSRLLRRARGRGAMLAIELTEAEILPLVHDLKAQITIAAYNGPRSIVLSGETQALEQLRQRLQARNIAYRHVKTDVAFHSPQMHPLQDELAYGLAKLRPQDGTIPQYSTVDGTIRAGNSYQAGYWARNLREPVLFTQTMERLLQDGFELFLEISPHPVLTPPIEQQLQSQRVEGLVLGSLRRGHEERTTLLTTLGQLYTAGKTPAWTALFPGPPPPVALPTYPWRQERYWTHSELPPQDYQRQQVPDQIPTTAYEPANTIRALLHAQETASQRSVLLEHCISERVADVLQLSSTHIDSDTPLMALGFDSITALELQRQLQNALNIALPVTLVWQYPTTRLLARYLAQQLDEHAERPS